jgi:flagellar protein FliS
MYANASDAYLETRVLSADPIELIRLLYHAASGAVRDARRHLEEGEIAARSRSISKACGVLTELLSVLDCERGGEIASRLAELYDYMHRKLIEANMRQADAPLAEVLGLLATLTEAWEGVELGTQRATPAGTERVEAYPPEPAALAGTPWSVGYPAGPAYASQSWSF